MACYTAVRSREKPKELEERHKRSLYFTVERRSVHIAMTYLLSSANLWAAKNYTTENYALFL